MVSIFTAATVATTALSSAISFAGVRIRGLKFDRKLFSAGEWLDLSDIRKLKSLGRAQKILAFVSLCSFVATMSFIVFDLLPPGPSVIPILLAACISLVVLATVHYVCDDQERLLHSRKGISLSETLRRLANE